MDILCVLFVLLFGSTPSFAQQFEGIIESKNATVDEWGNPQQFTMMMFVAHDMVRVQTSATTAQPGSVMIYRGDKGVVWMLNEEDSTYFEIHQDEQAREVRPPSGSKTKPPVVQRTGRKRRVLGYDCEQMVVKADEVETEIWATKSLGELYSTISKVLGGEGSSLGESWENKIMELGYYPLTASSKLNGRIVESQELIKMEKKPVPRDLFELPPGYQKQTKEGE